jgi:hypothetical protein
MDVQSSSSREQKRTLETEQSTISLCIKEKEKKKTKKGGCCEKIGSEYFDSVSTGKQTARGRCP